MQGQSESTNLKEFHFEQLIGINIKIVFSILDRWQQPRRYTHFDLNAGCGVNHKTGCNGSPLAFISAAKRFNGRFSGHFVDADKDAITELRSRLPKDAGMNLKCYNEDNRSFLKLAFQSLTDGADFGSILVDPNNHEFPVDELKYAASIAPKLDLFVSIGFTTIKRMRESIPFREAVRRLATLLSVKKNWLIRTQVGRWNWSILVGRNTDQIDDWKAQGFYKLSDPRGYEILENAITTTKEREENPGFYIPELRRILADAGIPRPKSGGDGFAQLFLL